MARATPGSHPSKQLSIGLNMSAQQTSIRWTERAGFEPAMEFSPHTRLAGECLQPLGHLSLGDGRASLDPGRRSRASA
jgi:hypothetical protein